MCQHTIVRYTSLYNTSRNTRRCSGGPQNKVRIHGSDLILTYFRHHELLAGCLATHKHVPVPTLTNNRARRDSRYYVTARQTHVRGKEFKHNNRTVTAA
jgi:hypothetical protein